MLSILHYLTLILFLPIGNEVVESRDVEDVIGECMRWKASKAVLIAGKPANVKGDICLKVVCTYR